MATETLIGSPPDGWEATTLGEVVRRGNGHIQTGPFGSQLHASDYVPAGIPSIMPVNIGDGRIHEEGIARITEADAVRLSRHRVQAGDIIYSRRGDVERCALVRPEQEGWLCGTGCLKVRFGNGGLLPRFAAYYLSHASVKAWIVRHAVGATMPNLNTGIMEALPVVVPAREVQQRIIHVLGTFDDKIDVNRRMTRTLERMAAAVFKSWFIDFDPVRAKADRSDTGLPSALSELFPNSLEESALGLIPAGWAVRTLDEVATVNARSISKGYGHTQIRYVDISSVNAGTLTEVTPYAFDNAPSRARRLVQSGDTIWSCVRPNRKAYLFIDSPEENLVVSTGFAVLTPREVPSSYLYQWVTTQAFVDYLTAYATGAAYPAVKADTFEDARMLLPPKPVLDAFHEIVGPIRSRIAHNERQNRRLAGLRDVLLPKLFSGELELPEAIDAAEEATA